MLDINKKSLIKQIVIEIAFVAILLLIDLLSKKLIFAFLENEPNKSFVVWEGIFSFVQAKNYGASFGIFTGQQGFLIVLTSLVLVAILVFLCMKPHTSRLLRTGLLMIVGGGIGNLVDRIAFDYVRDFIDYVFLDTFFGINFAIGNIADIFLLIGTLLVIVYVVFELQQELSEKEKKAKLVSEESQNLEEQSEEQNEDTKEL